MIRIQPAQVVEPTRASLLRLSHCSTRDVSRTPTTRSALGGLDEEGARRRRTMPVILWLLGVPLSLIIVLWLLGVFH
jgi:hypothetical protein